MANKDRNRENQSHQDWDQRRNQGENDYQSRNYNEDFSGSSTGHQRDYENQGANRNTDRNNEYGFGGVSSGNQYNQENDWNQRQRQGNSGMYGNDFGRERKDRERRNINSGSNTYNNLGKGDRENYSRNNEGTRNMYGGDTSNYGNANQGSFDRGWWDRTKDEVSSWFGDDDAERRRNRDDRQSMGEHRGKGPKDYQRSEERIREDVCDRLSDDDRVDASHIQVQVQKNEVILTGNVSNRDEKRRAEDLVDSISGVRNVENRIRVGNPNNPETAGLK